MTGQMKQDHSPVWHPFTQHAVAPAPISVARAEGAWLETHDGKRIFDAICSWWVATHGHCHPKIVKAIEEQAEQLDQIIFAGFTHDPAEAVAKRVIELTPDNLTRAFFSDSGSTAVEVALKMALGYWRNLGEKRHKIIALEHAYHGDTVAAMSVGERGVFNVAYEPLLFDVARIPFPEAGKEQATIDALDDFCRQGDIAALMIEPLVLGAGGMQMYAPSIINEFKRVLDAHNVLLIADEIMTGWGRTGTLFAMDQTDVTADIMCVAKGVTGGILPLALTLASEKIFDAHYSTDRRKTFFHSSSFTANAVACAAAKANLDIWSTEPVLERIQDLVKIQSEQLSRLAKHAALENPRQCGTLTAIDLKTDNAGYLAQMGPKIMAYTIEHGVLIRPLGNTLYVMPPYCSTRYDLETVYDVLIDAIDHVKANA